MWDLVNQKFKAMKYKVLELPTDTVELNKALGKLEGLALLQLIPASKFTGQRLINGQQRVESFLIGVFRVLDA